MATPHQRSVYVFNLARRIVQGVIYQGGRRHRPTLATFEEAAIDAEGRLLPALSDRARDRLLELRYREAEARLAREAAARPEPGASMADLWARFAAAAEGARAPATAYQYRLAGMQYREIVGDHPSGAFGLRHLDRYIVGLRARGQAPTTINLRINGLRALLRWARDRGELAALPRLPSLRTVARLPVVLSPLQARTLIERLRRFAGTGGAVRRGWARIHLRAVLVLLGTGLRAEELLHLPWRHVDLQAGIVHVRAHAGWATKERRDKDVPLPPALLELLTAERTAHPDEVWVLDDGRGGRAYPRRASLSAALRRHLDAIGASRTIKPLHGFRALYATTLHAAGVDVSTIQHLMGHRQIAVTQGYLADPGARAREAVGRLPLPYPTGNTPGDTAVGDTATD